MIIAVLLVALVAALLVLASERRLNNRLQRQLTYEQQAFLDMRERVSEVEHQRDEALVGVNALERQNEELHGQLRKALRAVRAAEEVAVQRKGELDGLRAEHVAALRGEPGS